jgi:integrase
VRKNQVTEEPRRHLTPKQIDRVFKRWCKTIRLPQGFSSHSMRATCATRALENGASLEQVQELLGHANPTTTKLYDRRGYNPERSASFFATY